MKEYSDSDIIESVINGDTEAFNILVQKYGDRVYNLCYRLAGNESDAKDLSQTVFIQAFKSIKQFKNNSSFSTYLHAIAVNTWINVKKRRKKIRFYPIEKEIDTGEDTIVKEMSDNEQSIEEQVEKKELEKVLQNGLSKLADDQRVVLILKFVEGKSYEEIAKICKCSLGTVGSRLFRALESLKRCLKDVKED